MIKRFEAIRVEDGYKLLGRCAICNTTVTTEFIHVHTDIGWICDECAMWLNYLLGNSSHAYDIEIPVEYSSDELSYYFLIGILLAEQGK